MTRGSDLASVLVRGPNWLGDLVMATPAFRALRAGLPRARLVLCVRAGLEPLLAGSPYFDAVIPIRDGGAFGWLREGLRLRAAGPFDVGLSLPDSWSSALLLRAAGVGRLVGHARDAREILLDQAMPLARAVGGRVMLPRELHALRLVRALGCPPRGVGTALFVTGAEDAEGRAALGGAGVDLARPFVALAPGASFGPSKLWPPGSFARVGDALAAEGAQVVLVGAPQEAALAARVAAAMRSAAADLTGRLGLGALKALLRRARVLVCNDAGARHVAVALGTPCVMLLGPTSLAKTPLNLERVRVLAHPVGCRPCYHRVCPTDHRCMTGLAAESVIEAALAAWREADRFAPVPVVAPPAIDDHAGRTDPAGGPANR